MKPSIRGQGRIFKKNGSRFWWVGYSVQGVEHRETTGIDHREGANPKESEKAEKQALRFLKQRTDEAGAARQGLHRFVSPQQRRLTVNELLDALAADYELRGKHSPQFDAHVKRIRDSFGPYRATDVTAEMVDAYIESHLKDGGRKRKGQEKPIGARPASVNRGTQLLAQSFKLAVQRRHLTPGSVPYIRRLSEADNVRQGYFTEPEFRRVVTHLPEYLQDFALFAYITGWRKNGIASLRWEDVDGDVILVRGEDWKNGEAQTVPVEDELIEIMKRRRATRQVKADTGIVLAKWVFHNDGARIGDFRKAWKTACKKAGVAGRLFHDLCRCAARSMDNAGVPRDVARQIMGRKTDAIYSRYRIVNEQDKRVGLNRRGEYMRATAQQENERVVVLPQRSAAAASAG
jgi:integrase